MREMPVSDIGPGSMILRRVSLVPELPAISFEGAKLARYKLPLRLHFVDEMPRNPAGKVLKYRLRELPSA